LSDILEANDTIAEQNRRLLAEHRVCAINLMSAPGAGKTSLLERTLDMVGGTYRVGVIEGDIETSLDAERLARFGIPVVQINTQGACHLDANMVGRGLGNLPLSELDLVIVENVGNLVCPAEFEVGETHKVMLLSAAEGVDKPLKYPLMFQRASLCVINKVDLVPYTDFDLEKARTNARKANPRLSVIELSCRTGEGMDRWLAWLERAIEGERGRGGLGPSLAGQREST